MSKSQSRAFWDQHILAWQQSGQSRTAWCAAHELSYDAMTWQLRQRRASATQAEHPVFVTPLIKHPSHVTVVCARLGNGVVLEFAESIPESLRSAWLKSLSRLAPC